jgi:alpha-glucoside transport system substrate-binding protein
VRISPAKHKIRIVAGISVVALVAAACGSSTDAGSTTSATSAATSATSAATSAESSASESESSGAETSGSAAQPVEGDDDTYCDTIKTNWPDLTGKNINVYAGIVGAEGDGLQKSWADFTDCTGATVTYNGDKNFEQQIVVQAQSGSAPDIAFVPQPGLLATLVATNTVKPAPQLVQDNTDKYWDPGWKKYGTINDTFYAAPLGAGMKSLVWYNVASFKDNGIEIPKTWDEMIAASDKLVAAGKVPWCAGIESGVATGWPATDWLEEIVMRQSGPDAYDQWVSHDIKFQDQPIVDALATAGKIWKNDQYVNGGIGDVTSIATTAFGDVTAPLLSGECSMMQIGNFFAANFTTNPNIAEDGDVYAFYLPPINDQFGKPAEVGGEFTTAFADRPEVQAFQYYLSTAHWANNQSEALASRISANKGLKVDNVQGSINKLAVEILQDPEVVSRFDASDLMPAAVGSGSMWSQLTAWITGQDDATTLAAIDASWPAS